MVVLSGQATNSAPVALVELKIAALDGGILHAGSASGELLTPLPLPYALPTETA
jgi:hypothetical protein